MAQGTSVARPQSSPLMKFPILPAASPHGISGAMKSVRASHRIPCLRAIHHIAASTPRNPPWNAMPPCQTANISSGCAA